MTPVSILSSPMIGLDTLPVDISVHLWRGRAYAVVRSAGTSEIVFQRTNLAPARLKKGEESLSGSG